MCAKQARADKVDKGRRPDCLKWCKGNSSQIEQYLRAIHSNKTEFLKTSELFVADAFFSVYPFAEGLATMGLQFERVIFYHCHHSFRWHENMPKGELFCTQKRQPTHRLKIRQFFKNEVSCQSTTNGFAQHLSLQIYTPLPPHVF